MLILGGAAKSLIGMSLIKGTHKHIIDGLLRGHTTRAGPHLVLHICVMVYVLYVYIG